MADDAGTLWTIDELRERVERSLSIGYGGVPSGRIRDIPDLRTIRYYTTLGLLDRPADMRGRTALYGRRHLLQLVAIKRLQAMGHRLSEIQQQLVGRSDAALERVATPGREGSFWREEPAPVEVRVPRPPRDVLPTNTEAIGLGADVTVSFPALRPADAEDLRIIRLAAAPLIEFLKLRGLIPNESGVDR